MTGWRTCAQGRSGADFQDARREVLAANARLLALARKQKRKGP